MTGRAWVFPMTLDAWRGYACQIANRSLSNAEREEYMPGRHYSQPC